MTSSRLALVADDPSLVGQIQALLRKEFGRESSVWNLESVRGHLTREPGTLLLLTAANPAESDRVLRLVREISLQKLPPLLMLIEANTPGPGRGLSGLDPYVADRFRWPADAGRLAQALHARGRLQPDLLEAPPDSVEDVIARRLLVQTPSLVPLVERIALAAVHDVTVLLTGETGTGKTHLARLLHDCSPRAKDPFLLVPCGALPANLVESSFFGHVKGAFTGATDRKLGKFEAAGRGTILLDEIDTLALEQQAGLLRVIETGEFEPVGSNETLRCEARIIVASNLDLEEAVRQSWFREDLYYRLNVMSFHLPPLRERIHDIAPLARAMAARFNTRFRKELHDISPAALDVLESYPWPGNIRQLENCIQQAVLVSTGSELLVGHLPVQIREPGPVHRQAQPAPAADTLRQNRQSAEKTVILRALASNGQNRSKAAAALGISRVTLYKKMRAYGLLDSPASQEN